MAYIIYICVTIRSHIMLLEHFGSINNADSTGKTNWLCIYTMDDSEILTENGIASKNNSSGRAIKKESSMEAGDRGNIHSLIFVNRHATLLTKSMIHSPRQYK